MSRKFVKGAGGVLAALSLTAGCTALATTAKNAAANSGLSTDAQSAIDSAINALGDQADLSGDSAGAASFLSGAADDGSGTGVSVQSLRLLQDVSGNLMGFTWPTAQSSASFTPAAANSNGRPLWLANGNTFTSVSRNKRWTTTTSYYVNNGYPTYKPPFGSERIVMDDTDGKAHLDEIVAPEATASSAAAATPALPAIFVAASPSLIPGTPLFRSTTLTFPNYGYTDHHVNTAVGDRWVVYDASTTPATGKYYPIRSWIRALQISRPNATGSFMVDHYDIATNYQASLDGAGTVQAPFEHISDDYNEARKTEWHMDSSWTQATTTWTGNGFFVPQDGATRSVSSTWNAGATSGSSVWTKTVSWTNAKGKTVAYTLAYNFDQSGSGTVTVAGTPIATLTWGTDLTGTATLTDGTTRSYRVPRP